MYNGKEQEMRERWIICATILILCYSSPSAINTTYGENPLNLVHPVGVQYPISQPFGPSSDQNLQKLYKSWQYDGHFGIDYAVPVGTAVFACDDGEVFEVNNSNPEHPNGLFLRIRHKWGSSVYCHLSRVFVHNGERVSKELNNLNIGSSGKTGFVTGPHLHFGMRISSIPNTGYKDYIDPQKYARFATPPVTQPSTSKMTRQKKPPEINKVQKLPSTKKIQQNQIVTKPQKSPGKTTIKAGHPEEAKKIFTIIRKKEAQRLSTQEVQKLASTDRKLVSKLERTPGKVIIGDGLIKQKGSFNVYLLLDGKKYLIPDRATLKSLNFEKQGVRVLTSSDFNSIPRGNFKELFALKKDGRQLGTQTEGVRKALETFEQRQADYHIEEYEKSINSELRNLKNQKAGNKVQRLPSTRKFNIPRIYKKTAKNPEKPLAKSNFVIPDGYKRTKSYYSRNIPSSSYKDSLGRELYLDSLKEMEKQYIEALKTTPNRNEGQSYIDQLGSFSPEERKQFEKNLKFLQAEIRNPSY